MNRRVFDILNGTGKETGFPIVGQDEVVKPRPRVPSSSPPLQTIREMQGKLLLVSSLSINVT